MLRRLSRERVSFGLHGRDHRTRFASPRRHSELCGLSPAATEELLDEALAELARHEIRPDVFVPPYNRFDAGQFEALARRFEVVCGGPESIGTMGFHSTPQWRGEAVYLPSYAPVYGRAADVLPAVERAIEQAAGLWVPVVLHWGWELQCRLGGSGTPGRSHRSVHRRVGGFPRRDPAQSGARAMTVSPDPRPAQKHVLSDDRLPARTACSKTRSER